MKEIEIIEKLESIATEDFCKKNKIRSISSIKEHNFKPKIIFKLMNGEKKICLLEDSLELLEELDIIGKRKKKLNKLNGNF